jgi:hypothetical protein
VYPGVPPDVVTVAEPFVPPLQLTLVDALIPALRTVGWVMTTEELTAHPFASVMVTV